MKQNLSKILIKSFLPVFSAVILVAGIAYAVWTEPTGTPPDNNAEAPLNTSANPQTKAGFLGIGITGQPTQQVDSQGYVKSRTGFCINDSCITSWPSGASSMTGMCKYFDNTKSVFAGDFNYACDPGFIVSFDPIYTGPTEPAYCPNPGLYNEQGKCQCYYGSVVIIDDQIINPFNQRIVTIACHQ